MKSKISVLTIILVILTGSFIISIYSSYINIKEHQEIELAWTEFIISKYEINYNINVVNQRIISPEEAIKRINEELQVINESEEILQQFFYGGDELVFVRGFKNMFILTKGQLEQAIIKPDSKNILRTTKDSDEFRIEIEHTIEESELNSKFSINITITIILIMLSILSWKFDRILNTSQSSKKKV